jgi:Reverse transcriptase (RNA-dependent DNA polymerase)
MFWRRDVILVIYTNDTIVTGPSTINIQQAIKDIGAKFDITSQEAVNDFLGVKIIRDDTNGTVTLTQPQFIDSILQDLHLDTNSNGRNLPSITTKVLHKHEDSPPHDESFHYRSVIGKLNYLEKSTRPDVLALLLTHASNTPKR